MSNPQLELVSHHLCPYVQRAVILLLEKDIPHQTTYIDLANKPDWFPNYACPASQKHGWSGRGKVCCCGRSYLQPLNLAVKQAVRSLYPRR